MSGENAFKRHFPIAFLPESPPLKMLLSYKFDLFLALLLWEPGCLVRAIRRDGNRPGGKGYYRPGQGASLVYGIAAEQPTSHNRTIVLMKATKQRKVGMHIPRGIQAAGLHSLKGAVSLRCQDQAESFAALPNKTKGFIG